MSEHRSFTPEEESTETEVDFRGLPLAIRPASAALGQRYWRIRRAVVLGPEEGHGMHHVFVRTFRAGARVPGVRVRQFWPDGSAEGMTEEKPLQEFGDWNAPLFGDWIVEGGPGPYGVEVVGEPSEALVGMGLPRRQHFSYIVEFEEAVAGQIPTPPRQDDLPLPGAGAAESLARAIRHAAGPAQQTLLSAMARDGFVPVSAAFPVTHDGREYQARRAQQIGGEQQRIYYFPAGQPDAVSYIVV